MLLTLVKRILLIQSKGKVYFTHRDLAAISHSYRVCSCMSVMLLTLWLDPFNSKQRQSEFHAPRSIYNLIGPLPFGWCWEKYVLHYACIWCHTMCCAPQQAWDAYSVLFEPDLAAIWHSYTSTCSVLHYYLYSPDTPLFLVLLIIIVPKNVHFLFYLFFLHSKQLLCGNGICFNVWHSERLFLSSTFHLSLPQ